jgi:hypothetical protein
VDPDTRRLTGIERRLVADDPQLGEAFVLWHQRCSATGPPDGDLVPGWVLAVVLLVLPAWVVGGTALVLVAGLGVVWLVFALAADDPTGPPPPDDEGPDPRWATYPSGWWT